MYCTARSTRTRSTSSCSNCMNAIVPVASWSSVWSIFSPIGSPGFSSPSTRWSSRIWRVRLAGISADVLAVDQLRDDLADPVDADRVVLALHVGPDRRVHPDEPAVEVHERPARVALVDHRVGEDHVVVRAD